jgi:lipopolysaccharide biosynthesis protein
MIKKDSRIFPHLLRRVTTFIYWLRDSQKELADFQRKQLKPNGGAIEESSSKFKSTEVVITAHIYYEDFANSFLESVSNFPQNTKVLVSTPIESLRLKVELGLSKLGLDFDVRKTPNIGRNFGPLLVEYSDELLRHSSFIHVHSKKSEHSPSIAAEWLKRSLDILLSPIGVQRIYAIGEANPRIGLIYPDASDLIRGMNYRWGRSRKNSEYFFSKKPGFEKLRWSGRIQFPAGGMFWVRTQSVRPLLEINWQYEMFPNESGQGDGTLQHGIERIIGELPKSLGFEHGVYMNVEDRFYADCSHSKNP